ncbi:peptidoglycan DD-metalloendopeptidase family protein [Geomicrobium sediminis]|uniref:Murein DD-endopeptidase MepM/ murein hydrolase activator NlpD n=1 Tax=Geomicrobium sediminis TaxID=1347788 RepID=A0ABS2PEW6_9BACL|nr:peptidoglycan DD-metalloendopeptidase family protein [Geomicrobium sediminis]MBM7633827.1 murein DD-endopeptidase MepM/ murein hydrolase activator NlpD [Geomicrobium sediminis]
MRLSARDGATGVIGRATIMAQRAARRTYRMIMRAADYATPVMRSINRNGNRLLRTSYRITIRAVDMATRTIRNINRSINSTLGVIGFAGGSAAGVVIPLKLVADRQNMETAFEVLLGSAEEATKRVQELTDFAQSTPFMRDEIFESSRILEIFTQGALATGDGLKQIGDIASGTQQPFSDVALWMGRMYDAMQSGRPIGEMGARLQEMGAISGEQRARLDDLAASGKDISEIWPKVTEEFSRFDGMMEKVSKNLGNLFLYVYAFAQEDILRPWGEGLSRTIQPALEKFSSWQAENRDIIDAWKEDIRDFAESFSGNILDGVYWSIDHLNNNYINNEEFQELDLGGRVRFVMDDISDLFSNWWSENGEDQVTSFADSFGSNLGSALNGAILGILGVDSEDSSPFAEAGVTAGKSFIDGFIEQINFGDIGQGIFDLWSSSLPSTEKSIGGNIISGLFQGFLLSQLLSIGGKLFGGLRGPGRMIGGLFGRGNKDRNRRMPREDQRQQSQQRRGGRRGIWGRTAGAISGLFTAGAAIPDSDNERRTRSQRHSGPGVWGRVVGSTRGLFNRNPATANGFVSSPYAPGGGGGMMRSMGRTIRPLAIGASLMDIFSAEEGERGGLLAYLGGSLAGGAAGAKGGAALGAVLGPKGAAVGGIVGAIGGAIGGEKFVEWMDTNGILQSISDTIFNGSWWSQKWEDVKSWAREAWSNVTDVWDSVLESADNTIFNSGWWLEKWQSVKGWFADAWGNAKDVFDGWLETAEETIFSMDWWMYQAGYVLGVLENTLFSSDWWLERWDSVKEWAAEKWESVDEIWQDVLESLEGTIFHSDWWLERWENVKTWAAEKWEEAQEVWESVKENISETIFNAEWWSERWEDTKSWAQEKWDEAQEVWDSAIDRIESTIFSADWWLERWDSVKNWASDKWNEFTEVWESVKEGISDSLFSKDWWNEKWEGVKSWATSALASIGSSVVGWVGSFGSGRNDGGKEGFNSYANGGMIDRPHLGLVGEAGPEAIIPLSSARRKRAMQLYEQTGKRLGVNAYANGGIQGSVSDLPMASGQGGTVATTLGVSSIGADFTTEAEEYGRTFVKSVDDGVQGNVVDLESWKARNIKQPMDQEVAESPNYGRGVVLGFKQGQDSTPTETLSYLETNVQAPFLLMRDRSISWGSGAIDEFNSGMRSRGANVSEAATELAKRVESAFRAELGINSPSTVMAEMGMWSALGFVNGLSDVDVEGYAKKQLAALMALYGGFQPDFGAGFTMTSGFGPRRSPGGIGSTNHRGVDYAAAMGTPIRAQAGGMVNFAGRQGGYGNIVRISGAGGMEYLYAHNSVNMVRRGQMVTPGQVIGLVGSTGNSTGPHVHYEVRRGGSAINPMGHVRGFHKGGMVRGRQFAELGETGDEVVIPFANSHRARARNLYEQTGRRLGIKPIDMGGGYEGEGTTNITIHQDGKGGITVENLEIHIDASGVSSVEELREMVPDIAEDLLVELMKAIEQSQDNKSA